MLRNVNSTFAIKAIGAQNLISWKYSFKQLNEEYDLANKKKQALDKLYETGKISQATHDSFDSDMKAALTEIEKKQKDLIINMQLKSQELIDQIATLETLLANFEVQHVVGEIEDEAYEPEINLMATSLDSAKNELGLIKQAMDQLCPETVLEVSPASEHVNAPSITDVPTIEVIEENTTSESIPLVSASAEAAQEVAPIENIPSEGALTEEIASENSLNPSEPEVEVITEPKEPEIAEPTIEPIISMEVAGPAIHGSVEQAPVPVEVSATPISEAENKEESTKTETAE